jgi:superfamily I DNA/RNA helicase
LLRIANVPARGLSDATMENLLAASHQHKSSVFAAMRRQSCLAAFPVRTRGSIAAFVEFVERQSAHLAGASPLGSKLRHELRSSGRESAPSPSLSNWAGSFLDEIKYFDHLRRWEKDPDTADDRLRNLKDLIATLDSARGDRTNPPTRLQAFLDDLTLDTEREEESETPDNSVTLITMHSCKGLEFPSVYIAGMEDGLLPHSRSKDGPALDEERRLFYVAVTRAMQTLTISHCAGRRKYGQVLPCHPSPFLKELPEDLVEHADGKHRQPVSPAAGKDLFAAMRATVN